MEHYTQADLRRIEAVEQVLHNLCGNVQETDTFEEGPLVVNFHALRQGERIIITAHPAPAKPTPVAQPMPPSLELGRQERRSRFSKRSRAMKERIGKWSRDQRELIGQGNWSKIPQWLKTWSRFRCGSVALRGVLMLYSVGVDAAREWAEVILTWMLAGVPESAA